MVVLQVSATYLLYFFNNIIQTNGNEINLPNDTPVTDPIKTESIKNTRQHFMVTTPLVFFMEQTLFILKQKQY